MKNDHITLALVALECMRGDDYARAKHAFAHYSTKRMNEPYGGNGETPHEILEGYRKNNERIDAAKDFLIALPDTTEIKDEE